MSKPLRPAVILVADRTLSAGHRLWGDMGTGNANGHLVAANSPGKMSAFDPADRAGMIRDVANRLNMVLWLSWDNQRAGGIPWGKRAILPVMGRGEVLAWWRAFKKLGRQSARCAGAVVEEKQAYAG